MRQKQDERLQFRNTEVVNRSRVEDGNSNRDPSPARLARHADSDNDNARMKVLAMRGASRKCLFLICGVPFVLFRRGE